MKRMDRFKLNNFKLNNLKLDNRGITLQTVIITAILALAAAGAGVIIYNVVSDNVENADLVSEDVPDIRPIVAPETTTRVEDTTTTTTTTTTTSSSDTSSSTSSSTTTTTTAAPAAAGTDEPIPIPIGGGGFVPQPPLPPATVSNFATNDSHSCAILPNKEIQCWGVDLHGQLGQGNPIQFRGDHQSNINGESQHTPVGVQNLPNVNPAQIAVGTRNSCTLLEDRTIWCWGLSNRGQSGVDPETSDFAIVPTKILAIGSTAGAIQIALGLRHGCAILVDKSISCWGHDGNGQLGTNAFGTPHPLFFPDLVVNSLTLVAVPRIDGSTPEKSATQISAGNHASCALLEDKSVKCWGQIRTSPASSSTHLPTAISGIDGTTSTTSATQVSVGGSTSANYACAILMDGTVKCWGGKRESIFLDAGRTIEVTLLGSTVADTDRHIPAAIMGLADVVDVSVGSYHVCAVLRNGEIRCWGENYAGQLGDNTLVDKTTPTRVIGISNASKVFAGEQHTCALLTDDSIKCWGSNADGQLGIGKSEPIISQVPIVAQQVSVGGFQYTCALLETGAIECWGRNHNGQLGDGTVTTRGSKAGVIEIDGTTSEKSATQISAGYSSVCALMENGSVQCWGGNHHGQLGDGTNMDAVIPGGVSGIDGTSASARATQISAGYRHACALIQDGTIRCWGDDEVGQLGNEGSLVRSEGESNIPVSVQGISTATQISARGSHSCALLEDKTIKCWGNNESGALGGGTSVGPDVFRIPVVVAGIDGTTPGKSATKVATGWHSSCAILEDKTISCWGWNGTGALLGGGTITLDTTTIFTPVPIAGISSSNGAVEVAPGDAYLCVLLENGDIKCWGDNRLRRLGDGTIIDSVRPTVKLGVASATQISAAYNHTCALLVDKTIRCWGDDSYNQLGFGTASTPKPVFQPINVIIPSRAVGFP